MNTDEMTLEILEDGTIRISTNPISPDNHLQAEQLLAFIAKMSGGEVSRTKRTDVHMHVHTHEHEHHHH